MGAALSFPVVDLSGRVAVVTGGNTGIGYETAKALAVMGAHTIIACRSSERATEAIKRMKDEVSRDHPDCSVNVDQMQLDLSSFRSTKQFTVEFKERALPLHILINNAGIGMPPHTVTEDGYEIQFQVNHLSHMLLTIELLPVILTTARECGDCRVVMVSSLRHTQGVFEPTNLNAEQSYSRLGFYCNSKLYSVMTGFALQRRLQNVGVTVSSLHPGVVASELSRNYSWSRQLMMSAVYTLGRYVGVSRDVKEGAATTINCAVNPHLNAQRHEYYDSCQPTQPAQHAMNEHHQEQLWEISVNILKDYVSPHLLAQYRPAPQHTDAEGEHG